MNPTNRLTVTIQAITTKHFFDFYMQVRKMIQPFLNNAFFFKCHLLSLTNTDLSH